MNGYSVRTLTDPVIGASGEGKPERIENNSAMQTGKFQRQTLCFKGAYSISSEH